jgi:hypothetical protein
MTPATPTVFASIAAMSTAGWTISIIAILTVAVIAWKELGVKEDLERLRDRWRRGGR